MSTSSLKKYKIIIIVLLLFLYVFVACFVSLIQVTLEMV